jgi:subtilisin family serine protease
MMHKLEVLGVALSALMLIGAGRAAAEVGDWRMTDRHVLVFAGEVPGDFASRVAAHGGRMVRQHQGIGVAITRDLSEADMAALAGSASIARDVRVQMIPSLDEVDWSIETLAHAAPLAHDPAGAALFPLQWDMQIIDADDAWDAGFEGRPAVKVAIVDSGIDPFHLDLAGLVDPDASIAFVPALTGPPDWVDDNFHGTHVAGIVATNGFGTSGVAPHTTLVAIKVCDFAGGCSVGGLIGGILYAADLGVDVINLSLGVSLLKNVPGERTLIAAFDRAVDYARRRGVLVVSAAGNDAVDLQRARGSVVAPCESGRGLCVAASGPDDLPASYSNFGRSAINLAAPGGDLIATGDPATSMVLAPCTTRSALSALAGCAANLNYLFVEGTSQGAPHVSGAAALLDAQADGNLRATRLMAALQRTADDLGAPGRDPRYGRGRLNVCKLLRC